MRDNNEIPKLANLGNADDGLPNIYTAPLNEERIKTYRELTELFRLGEASIAYIFNKGADWYKNLLIVDIKEVERMKKIISRFSDFMDKEDKEFMFSLMRKAHLSHGGRAVEILTALCQLKSHKDTVGKNDWYEQRQPETWKAAFEFLKSIE